MCCGLLAGISSQKAAAKVGKDLLPGEKSFKSLLPGRPKMHSSASGRLVDSIYNRIHLNAYGLSEDVFYSAYKGYQYLLSKGSIERPGILTICDYSQSSHHKRLYVINLHTGQLVYNTYVSHGRNSGGEYANSFSNSNNSNKSSVGFIVTGNPYHGKAGLSLHLNGMESGFNSNVYDRSIVLHGSYYVNSSRADEGTMMGRSLGCPAVPYGEQFAIIDYIKGGSCMFINGPDMSYASRSQILNSEFEWPSLSGQRLARQ